MNAKFYITKIILGIERERGRRKGEERGGEGRRGEERGGEGEEKGGGERGRRGGGERGGEGEEKGGGGWTKFSCSTSSIQCYLLLLLTSCAIKTV